ncbi:MAG: hypothetical protein JRF32_07890 [Deltaproteobacteria bacterium]|nr:hypothetical protein [Deltaproteobacteria bacterium]MBW2297512.1 hypothetical protein [Deltaproteobacteria bacterium]
MGKREARMEMRGAALSLWFKKNNLADKRKIVESIKQNKGNKPWQMQK